MEYPPILKTEWQKQTSWGDIVFSLITAGRGWGLIFFQGIVSLCHPEAGYRVSIVTTQPNANPTTT